MSMSAPFSSSSSAGPAGRFLSGLRAALRAGAGLAAALGLVVRRGAARGAAPARAAARTAARDATRDAAHPSIAPDAAPDAGPGAAPAAAAGAASAPVATAASAPRLLSAAVGPDAPNRRADVARVQALLAARALAEGARPIAVDGIWGPRSAAALAAAQAALTGGRDGRADPGGPLIAALQAFALPRGPSMALLRLLWPDAPPRRLDRLGPPLLETMRRRGIATDLRAAHFLAQVGHESGGLRWIEELASGAAYEGRSDLGNTRPGDGARFKGRGLIQVTGRANYARFGAAMGCRAELLADPALLADDPVLCAESAGWYWTWRGISAHADRDDLESATRAVNGGLNGLEDRRAHLDRAKALLGL